MSDRLRSMGLHRIADRLLMCATNVFSMRCHHALCPRCRAWVGGINQRRAERLLASLPQRYSVAHLTIELGADDIVTGRAALVEDFATMRRRTWWRSAVVCGRGTIEIRPAVGSRRAWNVHGHVMCITTSSPPISTLEGTWGDLVGRRKLPGRLEWQEVTKRFAVGKDGKRFSPIGFYTSKRKTTDEDGYRPWLDASDAQLREIALDVPGKRLGLSFGKVPKE